MIQVDDLSKKEVEALVFQTVLGKPGCDKGHIQRVLDWAHHVLVGAACLQLVLEGKAVITGFEIDVADDPTFRTTESIS